MPFLGSFVFGYNAIMKLTKYQHACFVVELDGQAVAVDIGEFTTDFAVPDGLLGVVATHKHPDHSDSTQLEDIVRRYPNVEIFTTDDNDLLLHHTVVRPGDTAAIGGFLLQFTGGDHAVIDQSIPRIHNVGLVINDAIYYPGDSFVPPPKPVKALLLPVAAPWMKLSEALDFVHSTRPQHVIPTHDAILSEAGQAIVDHLVGSLCAELNITYTRLLSGESITID